MKRSNLAAQASESAPKKIVRGGKLRRFTGCRAFIDGALTEQDIWTLDGIIIDARKRFYESNGHSDFGEPEVIDCGGLIISPGYIDIQINGAFGVDFADTSIGTKDLALVAEGLLSHGCVAFLPTLVSSSADIYHEQLPKFQRMRKEVAIGAVATGLHLEGPYMNPAKKGAHNPENLTDPSTMSVEELYGPLDGVQLVTLAPELPGSLEAIDTLSQNGVVVSMGHTLATVDEGLAGKDAGATLITHLFNAMNAFHHRDPGLVGLLGVEQARRPCYSIIADGLHCHPASVKIAYFAHPAGTILVTDAMAAMGLADGRHALGTLSVDVTGNKAVLVGTQTLAGAVVTMDQCVRNFRGFTQCSIAEALEAATARPARLLYGDGTVHGTLRPGARADMVLLDDELHVQATYMGGQLAWARGHARP